MKKKFWTIAAILIACVFTLSGCGFGTIVELARLTAEAVKGGDDDDNNNNQHGSHGSNNNNNNQGNGQNTDPNGNPGFGDAIVQHEDGVLEAGLNVLDDGTFFYVTHDYSDISYAQAMDLVSDSQNYMILGAYSYPSVKRKCSETVNYEFFSNKSMEYGLYDQYINGYSSSTYNSVLPIYVSCFNGYNKEFSSSISEFTGSNFVYNVDNPFYDVDNDKKQDIYNLLLDAYGEELAEEYYANYLRVLSSNYIEFVYLTVDSLTGEVTGTTTYGGMYFLEVDEAGVGKLTVADVMIDLDTFEMNIQNPDNWIEYEIVLAEDNNGYRLYYGGGFSMNYEKTTDNYLLGYVGDDSEAFHDIVGIEICDADSYYYSECGAAYLTSYNCLNIAINKPSVYLRDGSWAVDPVFEFKDGNMVTISFNSIRNRKGEESPYEVEYTVEYHLIGFMHDTNLGFVLVEDEKTYYFVFDSYDMYTDYLEGDPEHAPGVDDNETDYGSDTDDDSDTNIEIIFDDNDLVIELIGKCD